MIRALDKWPMASWKQKYWEWETEADKLMRAHGDFAYYKAQSCRQMALNNKDRKTVDFYSGVVAAIKRKERDKMAPKRFGE